MEQYAYIRVSTKEQHIDRQIMALKPYGISQKNIWNKRKRKAVDGRTFGKISQKKPMLHRSCLVYIGFFSIMR